MKYFVPSKTFLVGEYSVLVGGAAIGLATDPSFEISYLDHPTEEPLFHPESPAGRYLKSHGQSVNVHLYDPYNARGVLGGFGKSTAEYFSAIIPNLLKEPRAISEIRTEYLELFKNQKIKPSGIDLVIQYLGDVVLADIKNEKYSSTKWMFQDLDFFIISTGIKIKTHEHLENLKLDSLIDLPQVSDQVINTFFNESSFKFIESLKKWVLELKKRKLTSEAALEFQETLQKIEDVLLVKPCGALGVDVMIVFFQTENHEKIELHLRQNNFKIQASRDQLTEGLISYVD